MKFVPDTSVIIERIVSKMVQKGEIQGTIFISRAVISELENQANHGRETGFLGLEEIQALQALFRKKKITIEFIGERPTPDQVRYAKSGGEIDAVIRDIAYKHGATLITADRVQSESAKAFGIKVKFVEATTPKEKIEIEKYFDAHTMSIHIKANTVIRAKRGHPGSWSLNKISNRKLTKVQVQDMAKEIVEKARYDPESFIEISSRGSTVVQYKDIRIVIVKPPVADTWEITAVRPIKKLQVQEYNMPDNLLHRLTEKSCGVIVTGQVGSGKSTFSQALANFYAKNNKIVKTVESPRDLQVDKEITQYSKNFTTSQEIHDILFLSRPDYIIFDEMRDTPDFHLYTDLRLAGSNVIGVLHANQPIDAVQRFITRLETGMIPSVLDLIIFMAAGTITKILKLSMSVKVPSGMSEADLARPVVEVRDYTTEKAEFEIYSYGEETVVIPVQSTETPVKNLASQRIHREFLNYTNQVKVQIVNENKAIVHVEEKDIPKIIGRDGKHVENLEKRLGIHLSILPLSKFQKIPYQIGESKKYVTFTVKHKGTVDLYMNNRWMQSFLVGSKGEININKRSDIGKRVIQSLDRKDTIELRG